MYNVYLLRSIPNPDQTYIGFTEDLKTRLAAHNQLRLPDFQSKKTCAK
jgi:predicted GIY-YIG superfamily endonuclease